MRVERPKVAAWLACFLIAGCSGPEGGPPHGPAQVGVLVVKTQPINLTVDLTGRTSAILTADVRPQVNGVIQARLFEEGGLVRAGQPLYQIDPAPYRASYESAKAGLAQAEAALTAAKLKADRYKDLVAINAVSRQDAEDADAAWRQDEANVQAQKAAVDQANINLGYTKVFAPVSGRIGKSAVTPGALVTADQAQALSTIQDLSRIYVDVTQSSAQLMKLERDIAAGSLQRPDSAEVKLILDDGSVYPLSGRLAFSDVTVDAGTNTVDVRAVFPNPDGALLPGLFVRARLTKAVDARGILIPQSAISRDARGEAVAMVVGAGDKVEQRVLTLGQMVGAQWQVTDGLKVGDRLIVEGLLKIGPGAPVKPVAVSAAP